MEETRDRIQAEAPVMEDPFASLPGEKWRPVPGYEGLYDVSSHGRVRSLARTAKSGGAPYPVPARVLKPVNSGNGFLCVRLSRQGKGWTVGVHVLVALAFIGPRPDSRSVVHHKDGSAGNNKADNLEWCTLSQCVAREEIQRRRVATRRKKGPWDNRPKPVELVAEGGRVVARFLNAKVAERLGAVGAETIRDQCRGRRSRTRGFQWRYAESETAETKEG